MFIPDSSIDSSVYSSIQNVPAAPRAVFVWPCAVVQVEEEVAVNGEKVENASEEEESEEMESDEEERLQLAEGAAQRGSCETLSQVGTNRRLRPR